MSKKLFDFCIGNPPYMEPAPGTSTSDKPVYNYFMEEAFKIADKVELITPGRFLFNAGSTPKEWNSKMLNDPHFTILSYEPDSYRIFSNANIMGGVAISYWDAEKEFGAIGTFTAFPELNSILRKVSCNDGRTLSDIIYTQNKFNLVTLNTHYPTLKRSDKRLESNIFALDIFKENEATNDIKILGIVSNKRVYRYVDAKFIDSSHENLNKYKIALPKSNGSPMIGSGMQTSVIGNPVLLGKSEGYTRTFIGIGAFDSLVEAQNVMKYIKGKFSRTMLGILKITQDNNPEKWRLVPLQNFTASSDIDWTKSIHDIDLQLYRKYGLSKDEIDFIETNVKEMA